MPNGDKTGPEGKGPQTGRKMGYCAGNNGPGRNKQFGMGRGMGCRQGRGFRQQVELSKEEQINILKRQQKEIEAKINELTKE